MAWFDELQKHDDVGRERGAALQRVERRGRDRPRSARAGRDARGARRGATPSVPFEQGRLLATLIPRARLLPLDSVNHLLLPTDPAVRVFMSELHKFTLGAHDAESPPDRGAAARASARSWQLVAQGLSNEQIAERLVLSVRTVERHLSNVYVKLRVSGKAARAAAAARFSQVG